MRFNSQGVALLLAFLILASTASPLSVWAKGTTIKERIGMGLEWIFAQEVEYLPGKTAYARYVTLPNNRLFTEDNAKVVSMLVKHSQDFSTTMYEHKLKATLDFLSSSQTSKSDFYHFWDAQERVWQESGKFYHWNAIVLYAMAYSSFYMHTLYLPTSEYLYYDDIMERVGKATRAWQPTAQRSDGAWVFSYPDSQDKARIEDNGIMLAALAYQVAYEYQWGNRTVSRKYQTWAEATAEWLLGMQEVDARRWGYGRFYDDELRYTESTVSNEFAVFGLTTYCRAIGSPVHDPVPSFETVRNALTLWADSFMRKMLDDFGGPYSHCSAAGTTEYPKEALAAAGVMRAFVEIWIIHGDTRYWTQAADTYEWLTGDNTENLDFQGAASRKGKVGGFYISLNRSGFVDTRADVGSTGQCVEALAYCDYIAIPELPNGHIPYIVIFIFSVALILRTTRIRRVVERRKLNLHQN